mgnify:CR=1 FL=1
MRLLLRTLKHALSAGSLATLAFGQTGALTWREVLTHPKAAAQPNARGKSINTLCPWNGKLYIGYGDFFDNTGPIAITSLDPTSDTLTTEWILSTEQISTFRPLLGGLYAISDDPKGRPLHPAAFAVGDRTGTWRNGYVDVLHTFDVATLTGTDLWVVGCNGPRRDTPNTAYAVAWRSLDGGSTWQQSLRIMGKESGNDDNVRFYFAGVLKGKLYVQFCQDAFSQVFDGARWSKGPGISLCHHLRCK